MFAYAQVVLSCTQDDFFARNRFSNFGDLGVAVKTLMDDYQKATRLNENINSIEDMQAFLERYVPRSYAAYAVHRIQKFNLIFVASLVQAVPHTKLGRVVTHAVALESKKTDDGPQPPEYCTVIHRHAARRYPAFRSQSLNVSKHVAVLSELARLVDVYHLLDVSQFEQELACADEHVLHYRELMEKLSSSRWTPLDSCCVHPYSW